MSSTPYIVIIITLIIAFAWYTSKTNNKKNDETTKEKEENLDDKDFPYTKKNLLTPTEYKFYKMLKQQCDKANLLICPKVRMEDFLNITDKENTQKYRGKVKSRHIDFLICNKDLYILAGLELDDGTHNTKNAKQTDEFKNNVFKAIDLPLFRIKTDLKEYEKEINKMIDTLKNK